VAYENVPQYLKNYMIRVKQSAAIELEQLPRQDLARISSRIIALSRDAHPSRCENLSGQERYHIRQGNYRVLHEIDDTAELITIVKTLCQSY